jgi:hypothetical protein
MRRLIVLLVCLLFAALLPMQAAGADPRVGPPLDVQIAEYHYLGDDGSTSDTATLEISGRGCVPLDAAASVLVTVDRFPDKVFTATPGRKGNWHIEIDIPAPVEDTYTVAAECDNYFGVTTYPQVSVGPDDVKMYAVAAESASGSGTGTGTGNGSGTGTGSGPVTASTGPRTTAEVSIGLAALALGMLLVWVGRPRRSVTGGAGA